MVLNRKKVKCSLWVGDESLLQVEEFKNLGILVKTDGRLEQEMDRWIGALSAVMRALLWFVVVKRELSQKAKPPIYFSIFVPTFTYGHEIWVVTKRTRLRIKAAETRFLRRVAAGLSLRDRMRSSAIWRELGVEPLLLRIKKSQLSWFWASG